MDSEVTVEQIETTRPDLRSSTIGQIEDEIIRATGNGVLARYVAQWLDDPVAVIRKETE